MGAQRSERTARALPASWRLALLQRGPSELQLDLSREMHRDNYFNTILFDTVRPDALMPEDIPAAGLPAAAAGGVGGSPEHLQVRFLVWALLRTTRGDVLARDLRVGLRGLKFMWTVTCLSCSSAVFSLNPLCHTLLVPHWVSWAHFLLKYILCLQCCRYKSSFDLYKNKLVPLYSVCNDSSPHAP